MRPHLGVGSIHTLGSEWLLLGNRVLALNSVTTVLGQGNHNLLFYLFQHTDQYHSQHEKRYRLLYMLFKKTMKTYHLLNKNNTWGIFGGKWLGETDPKILKRKQSNFLDGVEMNCWMDHPIGLGKQCQFFRINAGCIERILLARSGE